MKAILRWGAALLSLLLLTSISHGYVWVSPVFKTPYPQAPGTYGSGYYSVDAYGQWSGPHYYLRPPFPPGGNILPGPIGQAIMAGNLPHTMLQNKEGMSLGNAPLLAARQQQQQQQGGPPPQQGAMGPSPMLGSSAMQQFGMMQTPHPGMATGQYAMPMPYAQGMPYQQMQAPMGYGPKPMMWAPYPGQAQPAYPMPQPQAQQPQLQATYWRGPDGIWLVQNALPPNSGAAPFATIPGFQPGQPMPGQAPGMGMMPPNMGGPGFGPTQQFNPMQQFQPMQPFDPLQRMQPPYPQFDPMQLPRMDPMPPQMPRPTGSAYPVHPFTRSPRDFFMWGEVMEQERARANRPLPVP